MGLSPDKKRHALHGAQRPKPPIRYRRASFDFGLRFIIIIKTSTQGAVGDWCALSCSLLFFDEITLSVNC
jgi:hypothetical protein